MTVGAQHASWTGTGKRGSLAWCDSDVTKKSWDCDTRDEGNAYFREHGVHMANEYGSPFSLMGGGRDSPFYIDGKLVFDWADSLNHPALVSSVDWDADTSSY